jgi:hypothetical protein
VKVTYVQIWRMRRPQSLAYYSVTKNTLWMWDRFVCSVCSCTLVVEKGTGSVVVKQMFKKLCQTVCNILMWSYGLKKKKTPIILVSLIAHHTPTLTSCNDILWLTWDFLDTTTWYSENSHLCWNEPSFITKQSEPVSWLGCIKSVTWQDVTSNWDLSINNNPI